MTALRSEIDDMVRQPLTRDVAVACAELAARAIASGDLQAAVIAKEHEISAATHTGMHQHAVVCCAEIIELWDQLALLPALEVRTQRNLIHALKHGTESALELPEIDLGTARELLATLQRLLERFSISLVALWTLEARLAWIEGDRAVMKDRMERVIPSFPKRKRHLDCSDCLGCTLVDFTRYMEGETDAAELEEFAKAVMAMSSYQPCAYADRRVPAQLAVAYVRQGRIAEARRHAIKAVRLADTVGAGWVEARTAALEVAVASADATWCTSLVDSTLPVLATLEEPYGQLAAYVAIYRALRALDRDPTEARTRAQGLARRIDARLASPRHLRETEAATS